MAQIIALGELLIDFTTDSTSADGYPTMTAHPGGGPANFLAAAAQQGLSTALIGKVGQDVFGKLLTATLADNGIGTAELIQTADCFTTLAFVVLDADGNREFSFARKPGADTQLRFDEINLAAIDTAELFHFGTLSLTDEPARSATQQAVAYAKAQGKLVSCDPNLRMALWSNPEDARAQMDWALRQADIVKISEEELEFLCGQKPEEGAKHLVSEYGIKLAFVTCGSAGAAFCNAKGFGFVSNYPHVKPIDTTGAGDIFGGTAMSRILALGKSPAELTPGELTQITRLACLTAALSTEQYGGISSVPKAEFVQAKLAAWK